MALLNKGIKLTADQTVIELNNRLFETATGTAFITIRPDVATANGTVTLLDPGSATTGYIKLAIQHVDVGLATAGYYFVIQTLGTNGQTINTLQSERISYGNEVTFGLTYEAAAGRVTYAISGNGIVNTPTNISAFTTGVTPVASGLALTTTKDTPLTIGANKYNGFLSKVTTYSTAFSADDLKKYVEDPSVMPTANQVISLDATQLAGVSSINTSVAEVQKLSFGAATNSGVLTIDGLLGVNGAKIVVTAGDSGAVIAEKVRASLVDSLLFKPQLEKQLITFTTNTANTSFKVAGVTVTVTATDTAAAIATKVKAALDANAFITGTAGRAVQDNGDGSVLVTFASADGDAKPIAVDSLTTTITASVDTVQTFNASGIGRKVTTDGASVLIGLTPADLNAKDLYVAVGGTGVTVTTPAAAVAPHTNELTSFIPSAFNFEGTPVGETQRFIVTKPALNTGEILTFSGTISSTTSTFAAQAAAYTSAQTAAKIATDLKAAVTAGTITNVDDVVATGDFVDIKFKPTAGNVANITLATNAAGGVMPGILTTPQQFAQNLQGESQTVTFTTATTAGNITVDGITVALAAADAPSAIATKVQTALVNSGTNGSGTYSSPEIQTITFLTGTTAAAAAGTFKVNGVSVTTAGAETTNALLTLVTTALNGVVGKKYTAAIDGDSVKVTFDNAARDVALMAGVTDLTGSAASITATAFSTTQEFNANGIRATRINSDGSLGIDFAPYEGTLGNVLPIIFTDTGTTATTASVATTQEAHAVKLTSSSYTGGAVTNSGAAVAANVMYAELVSVGAPVGNTKKLVFDVFVDSVAAARVGGGYESVGFTLNYPSADIASGTVKVDMATSSSSPITNLNTAGQIVMRWLDSASVTDFSKRIARVTVDQQGTSGVFKDTLDLSFTNVDIDGVDFTDGVTNTRTFADAIRADRWDVKQKLVNGLDATTPIGGEFVGYYGNPTVSNPQLTLKYASLKDTGSTTGAITLTNPNKTLGVDVVSAVAAVKTAKFSIELPSNGSNFSFALSPAATAAGLKLATGSGIVQGAQGRTYFVQLDGGNAAGLAKDATIGTLSLDLNGGKDKTHEFAFHGASTLNGVAATPQGMYFGYTATETQTTNPLTGLVKGEWRATDMPKGTFNKFFVDVIPSNAAKVITAADALQILKLSAGYGLDWKTGTIPDGTFAAADIDGSGKITAADALIALKYATGIMPAVDPVKWKFYDNSTANLSVESARTTEVLRAGMAVAGGADIEITASNALKDYFVQAILVGNVTNPALEI